MFLDHTPKPAIKQVGWILALGEALQRGAWLIQLKVGFPVAWLDLLWFQKTREILADVL